MLDEKIRQYAEEIERFTPKSADEVEAFRLKFLVAKGVVRSLFEEFKSVPADQKRVLGKTLNEFKQLAEHKFSSMQAQFESASAASKSPSDDLTLPGEGDRKSTRLNSSHVKISYAVFCLKKKTR